MLNRLLRSILRWAAWVLTAIGLTFLVVTFTPIVRVTIEHITPDWNDKNGDVLVVLGGSMLVAGTGPRATMGEDTYLRCVYAAWVLHSQSFAHVVVTGNEGAAEAMARYLQQNGVPADSMLIENRAGSTFENALYTKQLLQKLHPGQKVAVTVLTSDYHAWRARRVFGHLGFTVTTIPVPDVRKRADLLLSRWPAFLLLLNEFSKDSIYFALGRI